MAEAELLDAMKSKTAFEWCPSSLRSKKVKHSCCGTFEMSVARDSVVARSAREKRTNSPADIYSSRTKERERKAASHMVGITCNLRMNGFKKRRISHRWNQGRAIECACVCSFIRPENKGEIGEKAPVNPHREIDMPADRSSMLI